MSLRHHSPRHRTAALAAAALLTLLPAVPAAAVPSAAAPAAAAGEGCSATSGVTVLVDSTALGGALEVGCAPEAGGSGAEALETAGFSATRADSGLICAVDAMPDPCPTEFTGEYWSYWQGAADGEWTAAMVGPDDVVTEAGTVEGWFWSDGMTPPTTTPAEAIEMVATEDAGADDAATDEDEGATADDGAADDETPAAGDAGTTGAQDADADADTATSSTPLVVGGALLLAGLLAAVVLLRRRSAGATGDGRTTAPDDRA